MKKKQKTALQIFADWLAEHTPKEKETLQVSHSHRAFVMFVDTGEKRSSEKKKI